MANCLEICYGKLAYEMCILKNIHEIQKIE